MENQNILIYENQNGNIKVDVRFEDKSIWLNQAQICELYGKAKSTISEHIKAIFEDKELDRDSTVRYYRTVQLEGSREVSRNIEHVITSYSIHYTKLYDKAIIISRL